jgi:hypothetical protein
MASLSVVAGQRVKNAFVLDAGRGRLWRGPETLESLVCHLPRLRRPLPGVARSAQALQSPCQKRIPIATMMHDMIGDLGRAHDASRQAQRAQRLGPQLGATQATPSFQRVPMSPRKIAPWGFAFAGHVDFRACAGNSLLPLRG